MKKDDVLKNTAMLTAKAVAHYWETLAHLPQFSLVFGKD
jgi:hypothetical protein